MQKYKYINLIKEIALTDFKLKYNGSIFGYLWSLLKPLLYFLVLYFVFTRIFRIGSDVPNYPIYLLLGVTLWGFFSEATSVCMTSIVSRGDLIRKVYFPRIILPVSASITSFITLFLNLLIVVGFALYLKIDIFSLNLLFFPLLLLEFYLFSVGIAFFLASLFVRFRDVGHIWEVSAQILFYATPIIYSLSLVPDKVLPIMMASPLAQIIQDFRKVMISPSIESSTDVLGGFFFVPYLLVAVIFIVGYLLFQKMAAKFAEEV